MKKLISKLSFTVILMLSFAVFSFAQKTVTGVISDAEDNEPLIGASVIVKGASTGTVTDIDGAYTVKVPAGAEILEFSYTGYETQTITITGNVLNVALSAGATLDEIVVVGYGTVRKRDVTGSVASLKEEDFNQGVVISADQLLQGRVPGVNITNNSGQPGGQATVKIRGNNSIRSGANPLYVVDGIPLDGRTAKAGLVSTDLGNIASSNPLNFLNPSDIASIEVLKDASSAAIYGARGSNGVILITTKKARKGELDVNFNATVGTSNILNKYDVLTGDEYRTALAQYGLAVPEGNTSTDAMDEILRTGTTQNYNFSVGTGGDDYNVRFSAGYQDVQGIVKDSGLKRYSATLGSSFDLLNDNAGVDILLISSHTTEDVAPISTDAGFTGNLIGQALQWNPTIPLMTGKEFTTGANNPGVGETTINPLQLLQENSEVANTTSILASISPYVNITKNLQYRYRFGVNYGTGTTRGSVGKNVNIQSVQELGGFGAISNNQLLTTLHVHTLNYNTEVSDNLTLGLLAGYEYQKFDYKGFGFGGYGFDDTPVGFDITNILQNSNFTNRDAVSSFADPINELQSYFARATLGIGERFDVTATVRADGSTKFGENNQYGIFPSFAARWNISEEAFLTDNDLFADLALRAGWGKTGNQEFPAGSAVDRYGFNANGGTFQENIGNPDLKWEESTTFNVGLDFAILDYRISGTVDYYNRVTNDLLLDPFVQEPGPPVRAWRNIDADLVNSGVEIGINTVVVDKSDLQISFGGNISFLQNELRNYNGPDILTGNLFGQGASGAFVQKHVNNMPLNTYFVRDYQGLDADGKSIFGTDAEGVQTIIEAGDPNANVVLGLTFGLNAGKLAFNMNWNGAYGHQLYNNTAMTVIPITNLGTRNVDANLIDGTASESLANAPSSSTRYLESGNFTKLANATLSYSFGNISSLRDVRISLTGQNLLVITDYTGFDPEVNTVNLRNGVPSSGIEYIPYPSARTILFGVNASF